MTSTLPASVQSCHWGFFDAAHPPALSIDSGEEVIIDTVSGGPDMLPGDGFHVPPELLEIHAAGLPGMPGHILTGPVAVEAAATFPCTPRRAWRGRRRR